MGPRDFVAKCVTELGQGKGPVDDGFQADDLDGADGVLMMTAAADKQALQADLLAQQRHGGNLTRPTAQGANQADLAAGPCRINGLGQGGWTAHFQRMIDANPARQSAHGGAPLGGLAIVDGFVRAHGPSPFELFVGG